MQIGQIYIAPVNWVLMLCTIGLVLGFQSSGNLAAAYGMAVTSTMVITTCLFFQLVQKKWGWGLPAAVLLAGLFLLVEIPFFSANAVKIFHGAWFPLMIAGIFFLVMMTWEQGREILARQIATLTQSLADFKITVEEDAPQKVRGQAIFLTGNPDVVPAALVHNLHHNRVLHSETIFLNISTIEVPRVPNFDKVEFNKLGGGFYRLQAFYGFMEDPNIEKILTLAREQGFECKLENASFFLGRQKLLISDHPQMGRWRSSLFIFLSQNALDASAYFDIPSDQVIEVGVQLQL
jgi:KUP system potassium uptake protein